MTTIALLVGLWGSDLAVAPISDSVRERLSLDAFYTRTVDVQGVAILGSAKPTDDALREAAWVVERMLEGRTKLAEALAAGRVRVVVMAATEYTTDVPEHRRMKSKVYWDRRARGLGGTPNAPTTSCGEENLLDYPGDPYPDENILIHEFAHSIHLVGMARIDPSFDARLRTAYADATEAGLWKGTYAAKNRSEYWAEGVQAWFDDNAENNALHNHVNTRAELKAYDPALAKLCAAALGDGPWRYLRPSKRPPAERAHLPNFAAAARPRFRWRDHPIVAKPKVTIEVAEGEIGVELDYEKAPKTVANFLRYVQEGYYSGGVFHRTVRADNQAQSPVKIAVVQASANPALQVKLFPPVALERTKDTGLKHVAGAISMARDGPDSAQDEFFLCIHDEPELDFGGKRNPDGQGFAAFGRIYKGMEIVRQIQNAPANEQELTPPIRIQRIIRTE